MKKPKLPETLYVVARSEPKSSDVDRFQAEAAPDLLVDDEPTIVGEYRLVRISKMIKVVEVLGSNPVKPPKDDGEED